VNEKNRSVGRPRSPAGSTAKGTAAPSQSLTRGLQLLECLAGEPHGMSLSDVAQAAGLATSTTHRLLGTLQALDFVRHDERLGLWSIGLKTFCIGNAFTDSRDFVAEARPLMHQLAEDSGETVNLGVVDDGEAVFIAQVESQAMMRMVVRLGSRAPLHASGVGKALLARMDEAQVAAILHRRGLAGFTASTLSSPPALRAALATIRRQGYAVDDEEHAIGLRCVAATIHGPDGRALAAISVSGPKARLADARLGELGARVARCAAQISERLGGRAPAAES